MSLESQTLALVEKAERQRFKDGTDAVLTALRAKAPVKTGETRASVGTGSISTSGSLWSVEVQATAPQAKFTDEGTGLFGPQAALIVPKVAKALHWIDGGKDVFAKSSKGSGAHKGWFSDTVKLWANFLLGRG